MDTKADALANVYAQSLFELAQEAGGNEKIVEVGDELEQVCELLRSDRRFREFLTSPIIDREARATSLDRIFNNRVTDLTLRALLVLNTNDRLSRLEGVNAAYDHLVQESFGRIEVNVYTPAPLGDEQLDMLRERVRTALDKEPVLHSYADPDMIGGIRLRIGDQLIDGSVSNQLKRLKQGLMSRSSNTLRDRAADMIDEGGEA